MCARETGTKCVWPTKTNSESRTKKSNGKLALPNTSIPSSAALPLFFCTGFPLVRLGSGPELRPVWELAGSAGSCAPDWQLHLLFKRDVCFNRRSRVRGERGETETIERRCGKDHENRLSEKVSPSSCCWWWGLKMVFSKREKHLFVCKK